MAANAAATIRSTCAALAGRTDVLDGLFQAALRGHAPRLAAESNPRLATMIVTALLAEAEGGAAMPTTLGVLLQGTGPEPRAATAIGWALLSALGHEFGPGFTDAVRADWSEAYVSLVQRLMAARWNRMDLVA